MLHRELLSNSGYRSKFDYTVAIGGRGTAALRHCGSQRRPLLITVSRLLRIDKVGGRCGYA